MYRTVAAGCESHRMQPDHHVKMVAARTAALRTAKAETAVVDQDGHGRDDP